MSRLCLSLIALAALPLLSACVAAILPLAALGTLGKDQIDRAGAKRDLVAAGAVDLATPVGSVMIGPDDVPAEAMSAAKSQFSGQGSGVDITAFGADADSAEPMSQILQSSGLETSPFAGFTAHALQQSARLEAGEGIESVVLIPRVDIFKPETVACEGKPLAVLIDLDSKTNSNWSSATTLYRQNGLVEMLRRLHASEIDVIWLSDEPVAAAGKLSAILQEAGLSQSDSNDFLFLDRGGEDRKQVRRWDAARSYCIVAIAGDDRADFDELYDYLLDPDGAFTLNHMFENGWFLTPPPLVEATEAVTAKSDDKEG